MKNEITEGNRLVAEFMGVNGNPKFMYNIEWEHLMLVLDKIESLGYCTDINGLSVVVESDFGVTTRQVVYDCLIHAPGELCLTNRRHTKIESVFVSCAKFAEWYKNKQYGTERI